MQAHQVRKVAVVRVDRVPILEPFLQVALLADLEGIQPGARAFQLGSEISVHAQRFGGGDAVLEMLRDDGHIEGGRHAGLAL